MRVVVVDDEKKMRDEIADYLKTFEKEQKVSVIAQVYESPEDFLEHYQKDADLILLDVEMPGMDGISLARRIRQDDKEVLLMFITNMAQYALLGYSVGALDFVMKPINYYTFAMKVRRVLKRVQKRESMQRTIVLNLPDGWKKIDTKEIYFVEIQNRLLYYHTTEGEYVVKGTMQSAEKMLESDTFVKCNHWYLVNLRHVKEVKKNIAVVGKYELEISRRNKTAFLKALTEYLGENI